MTIKENTRNDANAIAAHLDVENGVTVQSGDVLEHVALPDGVTVEQYKAVQKHENALGRVIELAVGEKAVPALKADKNLQRVTGKIQVGARHYEVVVDRSAEVNKAAPGAEKNMVTVYGKQRGGYVTTTGAEHKSVRSHIQELAQKAFGK